MAEDGAASVAAVLPTYNRSAALQANLARLLGLAGIERFVVVDDGSSDATADFLATVADPRLRVVRHERNRGLTAARNSGALAVETDWVLYLEDDCGFPTSYAEILVAEAVKHGADIVGAPWLNVRADQLDAEIERRRAAPGRPGLHAHPSTFPAGAVETPFLPAPALVRRRVFDDVRYDERLRGNAWREETDFFVSAARAGYRCVLTDRAASWQQGSFTGGAKRSPLVYEWWVWRNNWRFLCKHGEWLVAQGHIKGTIRDQLWFVLRRRAPFTGMLRARMAHHARRIAAAVSRKPADRGSP